MSFQLDQAISAEINDLLKEVHLNTEMIRLIQIALKANSKSGELFSWAHLSLLSCECAGGVPQAGLPGAIAMELLALAADILDDLQDQDHDDLPWRQLTNIEAMNLVVGLLMLSHEAASRISDPQLFKKVNQILNHSGITALEGQSQEFAYDAGEQISLEQYFELVKRKSGSLTACACKIGAVLGAGSEALILQLGEFGTNLGIMGQIRNDLNDFLDFERKKDFINKKKTLPYVYLLSIFRKRPKKLKKFVQLQSQGAHGFGKNEQEYLKQIVLDEGVSYYCKVMYDLFRQKARTMMMDLPVPEKGKEKLIELVEERA